MNGLPGIEKELREAVRDAVTTSMQSAAREAMAEAIAAARDDFRLEVKAAIASHFSRNCTCPVPPDARGQVIRILDLVQDAGEGDLPRGVAEIRANTVWVSQVRRSSAKHKGTVITSVIGLIVAAVAALLLAGSARF